MADSSLPLHPIISRQEATQRGFKFYFTGKPCKNGHLCLRYVQGLCFECSKEQVLRFRKKNPDCRKEESRKYRGDNPERVKQSQSAYYENHSVEILQRQAQKYKAAPERFRNSSEKWRNANRDKVNEAKNRRRKSNPEKARIADKAHRQRNRENVIQRTRDWKERNRDHIRAYDRKIAEVKNHARRARKMLAEGTYTAADIAALLVQQSALCVGCKRDISKRYTIDHKVPLSRDGSNWPANLQFLCKSCNCKKGARTMDEWLCSTAVESS